MSVLSVWKEAINSASDLLLSPSPCVPLLSFRHFRSHLLAPLEKARWGKVWEVTFLEWVSSRMTDF